MTFERCNIALEIDQAIAPHAEEWRHLANENVVAATIPAAIRQSKLIQSIIQQWASSGSVLRRSGSAPHRGFARNR